VQFAVQAWDMLVVMDVSKSGRGMVSAHSGPVAGTPTPRHFLISFFPFFLSLVFWYGFQEPRTTLCEKGGCMSDLRPVVASEQVLALLDQHFGVPISDLVSVEGGQVARTFAFRANAQDYIIRFNHDTMLDSNLPKEAYLMRKFAGTTLPLPPLLHVGRLGKLHFAISRKMPGQMLELLSPQEVRDLLPQILDILAAIHGIDISDTQGYGVFSDQGQGYFPSWRDHLHMIAREEAENDYFGKWYRLFDETFLERDLYQDLYRRMCDLLVYCPEDRFLIRGGLSLRDVLAQDGKITAVLDWVDASYGDFVYDIAGLDFWWPWLGMRKAFQEDAQQRECELPFYAERLLCYQCYLALGALRFFAKSGQEQSYQLTRALILRKLDAFAG
jgi:hygromycin-B 4-O-kinase